MMNLADTTITDNHHKHRFELKTDDKLSIVEYQNVDDETLALTHTEVDPSLEGQGVGSHLVKGVLEYVERNNLKIVPLCPFVSVYLKRHPDWNRVVSTTYNVNDF
ncbi:GNAT family N-acetyltransferase [Spirosoma soli]|uniref:GNAT family N-acetyltransferase n=1 Tax=Spirosoma soli TaxID=1770529 RepID=A0ABW5M2U7_9BACT